MFTTRQGGRQLYFSITPSPEDIVAIHPRFALICFWVFLTK